MKIKINQNRFCWFLDYLNHNISKFLTNLKKKETCCCFYLLFQLNFLMKLKPIKEHLKSNQILAKYQKKQIHLSSTGCCVLLHALIPFLVVSFLTTLQHVVNQMVSYVFLRRQILGGIVKKHTMPSFHQGAGWEIRWIWIRNTKSCNQA